MVEIIGVRFNSAGKIYYFDPKGEKLNIGEMVIVETARGVEMGRVSIPNRDVDDSEITPPLKEIIRVANDEDISRADDNKAKEKEAFSTAVSLIHSHKLKMKLIDVEYTFDRSKILFYFTADGRVDFRELVKSLAGVFRTRIELRQIGVRDEARQLGSIGICGRFLCCSTFLDDFRPVSIKMAKEQGLSLNPTKISGVCGRLMCCLQYEQSTYDSALKSMPMRGATVETVDGRGVVVDTATLKQQIRVKLEGEEGHKTETYKVGEFNVVGKEPTVSLDDLKVKKEEEALAKAAGLLDDEHRMGEVFTGEEKDGQRKQEKRQGSRRRNNQPRRKNKKPQGTEQKKKEPRNNANDKPKNTKDRPKKNNGGQNGNQPRRKHKSPKNDGAKKSNGGYTKNQQAEKK